LRKIKKKRGRGSYRSKKKLLRGRCWRKAEKLRKEDLLKKNRRQL
jgi:stalled ribosome alternative rescue factor ArfA